LPAASWAPQPGPQTEAISASWCPELFFGGARGGGKSDYLLGDFLRDVPTYGADWRGVLFRRTYPELQEIIVRSRAIYGPTGATWREADKEWHWPNGAFMRLRYLEREADASRYQGHQYTWIGWDELTQWPADAGYRMLFACLRSAADVRTKRVRAAGNPGGPGHQWVKARFIDPAPGGFQPVRDETAPWERMFVPSRVEDNAILLRADPAYVERLRGAGSPELVRAWLEGDWAVISGAFFPEFATAKHIVRPVKMPNEWARFRAMDWGSARPFSVGWYAVSDGTMAEFPRGALIRYREWYGSDGRPNVGLRMTAEQVADGIKAREAQDGDRMLGVADPAIFAEDGGPSIAERMQRRGVIFRPADNKRVAQRGAMGGWDQVRSRLRGDGERPALFIFDTCKDLIRTLPALQHDQQRPEDLDTEAEDHAADELRYACMSRPYVVGLPPPPAVRDRFWRRRDDGAQSWKVV
jgi:hypothetical protein